MATLKEMMQRTYEEEMCAKTKEVFKRIKDAFLEEQKEHADGHCFYFDMKYDKADCLFLDNRKGKVITLTEGVLTEHQMNFLFELLRKEGIGVTQRRRMKSGFWRWTEGRVQVIPIWLLSVDLS